MASSQTPFVLDLEDGKYTVTSYYGVIKAERYREPWRDLTGDKLFGAMLDEIERLKTELANTETLGGIKASHPTVKFWRYDGLNVAVDIAKRWRDAYREAGTDDTVDLARVAGFIMNDINGLLPVDERRNLD